MKQLIKERMSSDKAAANTVEIILIIALAVFAGLALFRYILQPVQDNANNLGTGISSTVTSILNSDGKAGKVGTGKHGEFVPTTPK